MSLGDEILRAQRRTKAATLAEGNQVAFGVVTATSPLTVRFNADTTGTEVTGYGGSGLFTISDVVICLRVGLDWYALPIPT